MVFSAVLISVVWYHEGKHDGHTEEQKVWRECPACRAHFLTSTAKTVDAPTLPTVISATATPEKP